jgi:hypothetical protein
MRLAILRTLTARFGSLSEEALAALQAADLPRLEHLTYYIALDTPEQVRMRLDLPTS